MGHSIVYDGRAGVTAVDTHALRSIFLRLTCYLDLDVGGLARFRGNNPFCLDRCWFGYLECDSKLSATVCMDGFTFDGRGDWPFVVGINLAVYPAGCAARSVVYE